MQHEHPVGANLHNHDHATWACTDKMVQKYEIQCTYEHVTCDITRHAQKWICNNMEEKLQKLIGPPSNDWEPKVAIWGSKHESMLKIVVPFFLEVWLHAQKWYLKDGTGKANKQKKTTDIALKHKCYMIVISEKYSIKLRFCFGFGVVLSILTIASGDFVSCIISSLGSRVVCIPAWLLNLQILGSKFSPWLVKFLGAKGPVAQMIDIPLSLNSCYPRQLVFEHPRKR